MLKIFIIPDTVKTLIDLNALLIMGKCQPKRISSPLAQQHFTLVLRDKPSAYTLDLKWMRRRPCENAMGCKSVLEGLVKVGARGIVLGCSRAIKQRSVQVKYKEAF